MKSLKDQTYYEILEISRTATGKEIQRAYEHAKETFHADSLAVYSLFSEKEVKELQEAVEEAYRTLTDETSRKSYDQSLFQVIGGAPTEELPKSEEVSGERRSSLSFTGLSFNADVELYRGKALKQVRERMGVDAQTISKETKISVKTLAWIEEEAFEKLPPLVYLRSFLKSYAQSLGLDPQRVLDEYLRFMEESKNK
ncbi:MAG TPA: helix-turn-helix domain-containing protein [Thermodesulfobacteriota bacterium]|nr:helix-turn-helix domain-containing protein [Thermodesulfobacteriota bacterium]